MLRFRRVGAFALALALIAPLASSQPAAVRAQSIGPRARVAYELSLPHGQRAIVFSNGVAQIYSKDRKKVQTRLIPPSLNSNDESVRGGGLPDKATLMAMLGKEPAHPYEQNRLIVVYRAGVSPSQDTTVIEKSTLVELRRAAANHQASALTPQYTNDATVNRALAGLGVDRSDRLFKQFNKSMLAGMHNAVRMQNGTQTIDFSNAYRLHMVGSSVFHAVQTLSKLPSVAYVSPDWTVESMNAPSIPLGAQAVTESRVRAQSLSMPRQTMSTTSLTPADVPINYATTSSLQSMLNAPSDDVVAAYDEIQRHYHQLPGQGEIVTNVSIGDLDDASVANNPNDPCSFYASVFGPTTEIVAGQRYLNLPSMPLIPTYTADSSGNLSGQGEVCGTDPFLDEIGLDFSMMAPLPHQLQRAGEQGNGITDLIGIAPGAQYRLIVPASFSPTFSDIDAALLGAALQTPRPNVITASLGFGYDQYGFSGRYLEDDPLSEAIVASIVQNYHIVVCISSGDGTRTFTTVAIGPSGGTTPTDVIANGGTPTNLNDVAFSGAPSRDFDSGSIDAGGTTLDDIFASPPQFTANATIKAQHAFAETRWTGFTNFSSGFGSRVNVSAPSDNLIALTHAFGGADDAVAVVVSGGTSGSSPEIAAASAVVLQVARLTGHPFSDPVKLRAFLESTGTAVPNVSQADTTLQVGPQIDLRRAVESLLTKAGAADSPRVPRVAVEQRRNLGNRDGAFESDTDPSNIDLQNGILGGSGTDRDEYAWITIAPDWEFVSPNATYSLKVAGTNKVIATTPWARLLPATILNAGGFPLVSPSTRTVKLTYEAKVGMKPVSTTFSLTFGPSDATSEAVLAPLVPSVTTGSTIPVTYDLSTARFVSNPVLLVSEPGRVDDVTGQLFHPIMTIPLTAIKGTIQVPVSSLHGGGIYGFGMYVNQTNLPYHSDYSFTRVVPQLANASRPAAPLLASNGSAPGHFLEIPYGDSFQVSYNVSNVPGATGAALEISAAGPTAWRIYNPFNNPNGSEKDNNGVDAGSVYYAAGGGVSGTITLNAKTIGLDPTMNHVVRVIPMKGGVAAGEGSDVSTVTMDGVFASDGGFVNNGFGVNGSGLDGFITSGQQTASGQILTSLDTFDQTNNSIVQTVASGSNSVYFTNGWGIYGGDIGLYGLFSESSQLSNYNLLNTVAAGNVGNAWTPPFSQSTFIISEGAANQANDNAAFIAYDTTGAKNDNYRVFTSQIASNTFSPAYDVSAPLATFGLPSVFGFAEDTATNTGVAIATDFFANCGAPTLITVDLTNGATSSFTGVGTGFPYGIAIDSTTGKAAVPTLCDGTLGIYNLATKTASQVTLPGALNGFYSSADQAHNLFLVEQTTNPDFIHNNNSLSGVLVYDENGNLQKEISKFNLFGVFLTINANNLQVNQSHRKGYLIGPGDQQLAPFGY